MDFTPLAKPHYIRAAERTDAWGRIGAELQERTLRRLLHAAKGTEAGRRYGFASILQRGDTERTFRENVPMTEYESIRGEVERMIEGGSDILWPGRCRNFAQSSGTSGGRSKFIPITFRSLSRCHYRGAHYVLAHYMRSNPSTRIFSGKAFVLGGSFASQYTPKDPRVRIGDLSATLIRRINPIVNLFRVPDMKTALMPDWLEKLPALVKASAHADVTNISGVPSWFLTVIKEVMKSRGADNIHDVWPHLEVFFHGGISFAPYREIYESITDPARMHFVETYNASEGFFAVQNDPADRAMLLLLDTDTYYEFLDITDSQAEPVGIEGVEPGRVYELLITSSNGLWRYRLGDTVRVESVNPVKITIAGRTKTFINAFGEELMEDNAERAMAEACRKCGAEVANYTAAPVYADGKHRGRHQWIVEWETGNGKRETGNGKRDFGAMLDEELRKLNSDYDAKRSHGLFLDAPEIITAPPGTFNRWLQSVGTGKLGGQRKVPRLSNDRQTAEQILRIINKSQE